jgi:uncharacterized protein YkwD
MVRGLTRDRHGTAVVGSLLVLTLLFSGIATDHARAAASAKPRKQMLALTNGARSDHGRAALALNARLSRYATRHSRDMARAGYLFHTEDLADKLKGLDWSMGGENVGVGSSLTDLQDSFMASRPHRRNILQKGFDHAAIGVVQSDGSLWVTVIFYG